MNARFSFLFYYFSLTPFRNPKKIRGGSGGLSTIFPFSFFFKTPSLPSLPSFEKGGHLSDRPVPLPRQPRRSLWRARGQAQNAPLAETIRSPKFAHEHRSGSPSAAAKRRRFTPDRPLTTLDSPDITMKTCADGRETGTNGHAGPQHDQSVTHPLNRLK